MSRVPSVCDTRQRAVRGHGHRMTCAQGSTSSSGSSAEVVSQGFPERGATALPRKGRIKTEDLAWGTDGEAVASSPLVLLPVHSSWGPQGSHSLPWPNRADALGSSVGGFWGLVQFPPYFSLSSPRCG